MPVRAALPPLIAIGCSTGGPAALAACLGPLPADLGAALLVAQHIEAQFAPGLARWLQQQIALPPLGERLFRSLLQPWVTPGLAVLLTVLALGAVTVSSPSR